MTATNIVERAKMIRKRSLEPTEEEGQVYLAYLRAELSAGQAAEALGKGSDTAVRTAAASYLRRMCYFKRAKIVLTK